jgi:hypothetical protein
MAIGKRIEIQDVLGKEEGVNHYVKLFCSTNKF